MGFKYWRSNMVVSLTAAAVLYLGLTSAGAFPEREIVLVVPFAPGGSTDFVARTVGAGLEKELAQAIVIENMPGANTIVGTEHVAKSAPDGYTLVVATTGHTTNDYMYSSLPYDAENDFDPVILMGITPNVIAVHPDTAAETLDELVDSLKESSAPLNYATAGHGTIQHFTGELLALTAGFDAQHIPYRGGGPAADAVMAGHVTALISGMPPAMPHIEAGRLKPLAITLDQRSPALPDTPTTTELGFPEVQSSFYLAIMAPSGTPDDVIDTLNTAFNKVLNDPVVRQRLEEQGVIVMGGTTADLATFLERDATLWSRVIQESGIEMIE